MEKVVIIDSGIGGLSVLNHLIELDCNTHVTYLADNRFFPYGTKSDPELIIILERLINYFSEQHYQHIFLACNTASFIYSHYLLNKYDVRIYPIIEHTILDLTHSCKRIGVIGTDKTIQSEIYQKLVTNKFSVPVFSLASSELVSLCEQYDLDEINTYIHNHFKVFRQNKIDTLILGCTHFNVISHVIDDYFNHQVKIICSGFSLIESLYKNVLKTTDNSGNSIIYLTKEEKEYTFRIHQLFPKLEELKIKYLAI